MGVVSHIVKEIEVSCPYSFECTKREFGGLFLWIVLTLPWLGAVLNGLKCAIPFCYYTNKTLVESMVNQAKVLDDLGDPSENQETEPAWKTAEEASPLPPGP